MKKYLVLFMVMALFVTALAGCGNSKSGKAAEKEAAPKEGVTSIDSIETIGDVIDLDLEETQTGVTEKNVVYVFKLDDTFYRVIAPISEKDFKAYMAVNFEDEDYEEQQNKIVAPLKIEKKENLSEQVLSDEELGKLVGKTGKELVKEGWTYNGSFTIDNMEFWMDYGPLTYGVVFDGKVSEDEVEDYDPEKGTADMKVKSVKFLQPSDNATEVQ